MALPSCLPSMLSRISARFAIASLVAWSGCGPSLQRIEQANVYFERCHAADRDPARSDGDRRACWHAWHEHYEVGQPDDRVDYVRERLLMLDPTSGDAIALATPDDTEGGERIEPSVEVQSAQLEGSVVVASAETVADPTVVASAEIAPAEGPELSDTIGDRPPRIRRRPAVPRTRTSACGASCEPAFVDCASACEVGDRGCADACRHIFRQCARGCF